MAWCPKCKMEYRDDIKICADCGSELLENEQEIIELEPFMETTEEDAEKFVKFLKYSGLTADFILNEGQELLYTVRIQKKDIKEVKKLYCAYLIAENEEKEKKEQQENLSDDEDVNINEHEESQNLKKSTTYVKKKVQYEDLKSSATTFLFFGVIGLIFAILNSTGVIKFINNIVGEIVLFVLFILFIFIGITTNIKAKKVSGQISSEEALTEKINEWLKLNVTSEFIAVSKDHSLSEEINFINLMEKIKKYVVKEFGEINDSYLDQIVEEFYNENY